MSKYNGVYLRVRNNDKFQHYRSRNPPWIKLHNSILEDYDFGQLPDATKWAGIALALIASRINNHIPNDLTWIKNKIGARQRVDLKPLMEMGFLEICDCETCASKPLAPRKQSAIERERERESRGEGELKDICAVNKVTDTDVRDVFERHLKARKKYFSRKNGRTPSVLPDLTPELRRSIRAAIDRHGKEKAMAAGVGIFYSDWHTGEESGKEYLEPHLCWRIQPGKSRDVNNVEKFAELAIEKEALYAAN